MIIRRRGFLGSLAAMAAVITKGSPTKVALAPDHQPPREFILRRAPVGVARVATGGIYYNLRTMEAVRVERVIGHGATRGEIIVSRGVGSDQYDMAYGDTLLMIA